MEQDIEAFLKFWDKHGNETLRVQGGVVNSPGCTGDYGCCAESADLGGLADALRELMG